MTAIEKKIKRTISQHLGVGEREITISSHLIDDLNASPLEIADLTAKLESVFQIKISEEEAPKFSTVGDVINFVAENIQDET